METSPCAFCSPTRCSLCLLPLLRVLLSSSLQVICTLVAAFLHFFFLSSFCWVLTEAWQSYMAVTGRLRNRIIRKRFLCLGWGEDAGFVEHLPSGGEEALSPLWNDEQRGSGLQEGLMLCRMLIRAFPQLFQGCQEGLKWLKTA